MTLPLLMGAMPTPMLSCPNCDGVAWLAFFAGIGATTILYVGLHYLLKD